MDDTNSGGSEQAHGDGTAGGEADRHLSDRLLSDAGLNAAEGRLYRALLDLPDADVTLLSWRLDLPTSAVESLLRRLVRRGFAVDLDTDPAQYRAVDPTIALHLFVARREHHFLADLAALGKIAAAVPTVARGVAADRRRRGQPDPPVTVLADPAETTYVRAALAATATETLRRIVTSPDTAAPLESTAARRCTIYRRRLLDDDATYAQAWSALIDGHDVRLLPDPGIELLAADEHSALLCRDGVAVLLHPSPLLDLAARYFDLTFDRAITLGSTPDAGTTWQVTDDDRALLALLAAGLKDQAIARRLGIGLRTAVRRIGNLARTLDAETRFQLGLQAKARDLI